MKKFLTFIPLIACLSLLTGYNFMSAQWAGPQATAPLANAPAPINVGTSSQSLQVATGTVVFSRVAAASSVWSPRYCDATGLNCWNPATGAGITQLTGGAGVTLSPTTITGTGTISINQAYTQRRVTGFCPAGQAIRQVNADGTVVCQASAATCLWRSQTFSQGSQCRLGSLSCFVTGTHGYTFQTCGADGSWQTGSTGCSGSTGSMLSCP